MTPGDESEHERVVKRVIDLREDQHLFIWVQRGGRPDVSLDLSMSHGRGGLSVRSGGMTVFGGLVDVEPLGPGKVERPLQRFCPYCGEELNLVSSVSHSCAEPS